MSGLTLKVRIQQLVKAHGSLREVARVIGIDHGYLCRLRKGDKINPSAQNLGKLGLRKVIYYERTKP